jgi:hypothetical protein
VAIIKTPPLQGSPPPVRSQILRDFTGGLNLRDIGVTMRVNELSQCSDVDLLPAGGVRRRASFRPLASNGLSTTLQSRWLHQVPASGATGLLFSGSRDVAGTADKVAIWSTSPIVEGASPDATRTFTTASTLNESWSSAEFARVAAPNSVQTFVHRDCLAPVQRIMPDTTLSAELTADLYNDNLAAPAANACVKSSLVCTHLQYLFHADTVESATRHFSRVRWSHPGEPMDFRTADFIDVGEGQDNDMITALISAYGNLFIFKRFSVWMLTGVGPTTWSIQKIASGIGTANKNAAVASMNGVFFFDEMRGAHMVTYAKSSSGRVWQAEPVWQKLHNAISDGTVTNSTAAVMCWAGQRLYVTGLKNGSADLSNVTYVHDVECGEGWWQYDVGFALIAGYKDSSDLYHLMGVGPYVGATGQATHRDFVQIQGLNSTLPDKFAATTTNYNGSFTHAWVDGGDQSLKKRFRRFSVVFDDLPAADTIAAIAYKNWDPSVTARSYTIVGTASVFTPGVQTNKRSGTIGTCYATAVKLTGPNNRDWRIEQVTHRFIPQRIV